MLEMAASDGNRKIINEPFHEIIENKQYAPSCKNANRNKRQEGSVHLAVFSGFFATIGSLFGKLAGGVHVVSWVTLLIKGFLLLLMVSNNTIGCTFFVKGLNISKSSLPCTIVSAATSYICSVVVGYLIFGEYTSFSWWCGTFLILLGLLFISHVPNKEDRAHVRPQFKDE